MIQQDPHKVIYSLPLCFANSRKIKPKTKVVDTVDIMEYPDSIYITILLLKSIMDCALYGFMIN